MLFFERTHVKLKFNQTLACEPYSANERRAIHYMNILKNGKLIFEEHERMSHGLFTHTRAIPRKMHDLRTASPRAIDTEPNGTDRLLRRATTWSCDSSYRNGNRGGKSAP